MFGATVLYIIYRLHADNFANLLQSIYWVAAIFGFFYYYGMADPLAEDSKYSKFVLPSLVMTMIE